MGLFWLPLNTPQAMLCISTLTSVQDNHESAHVWVSCWPAETIAQVQALSATCAEAHQYLE